MGRSFCRYRFAGRIGPSLLLENAQSPTLICTAFTSAAPSLKRSNHSGNQEQNSPAGLLFIFPWPQSTLGDQLQGASTCTTLSVAVGPWYLPAPPPSEPLVCYPCRVLLWASGCWLDARTPGPSSLGLSAPNEASNVRTPPDTASQGNLGVCL